ncbi:adenylate/guanylate cyclase domain-containing protein [Mesorhizobium mediterraneum]|uniref:adenylate/guanylate cyclase domain-containing protein n=1 Tax=Mesorhizobium mediterraneum TaxID=43617 RepID=UPI0017830976|nr:adenylate/guanylate cyclase domain-containing protein [Mesorhizobium mediterraneum]
MNDMGQRKLVTILAADVASYSTHVERNEERALAQLAALRTQLDRIIENRGGRIANTAGDSVIAEFQSPVEAVKAAIEIQQAHRLHNENVRPEERLQFRVGINIGDVVVTKDGDLLGNGVNVASRLETFAEPGGICLSENVQQQIDGHISFPVTKIGEHYAKNMLKPIRVYSIADGQRSHASYVGKRVRMLLRRPSTQIGAFGALALGTIAALYLNQSEITQAFFGKNLSAFDGTWKVTRRASNAKCGWPELATYVSVSDGVVSSDSMKGEVSRNGAVSITLTFIDRGIEGKNILNGSITGDWGTGEFVHIGGECAGIITLERM